MGSFSVTGGHFAILTCFFVFFSTVLGYHGNDEVNESKLQRQLNAKLSTHPPPGIGFDLTAFYGTAVISYPNGTTSLLARVPAPSNYAETLQKLSLETSKHLAPPYDNWEEEIEDRPRQELRKARKAIGEPASEDVAALSALLSALRSAAEEKLGHDISEAVASTPNLVALYDEDVRDAFEYLGLKFSPLPYWQHKLLSTGAAYAGYGLGLCKDYLDQGACWDEQKAMGQEIVMAVTFTRHMVHVTLSAIQSVLWMWEPQYRTHLDWELGLGKLDEEGVDATSYWEKVGRALRWVMEDRPHYPKPDRVLLLGESTNDERFLSTLEGALKGLTDKMPIIHQDEAEYVAAKGAAELAKRAPYDWRNHPHFQGIELEEDIVEKVQENQGEGANAEKKAKTPKQTPLEMGYEL